jgi:hypothetical protein
VYEGSLDHPDPLSLVGSNEIAAFTPDLIAPPHTVISLDTILSAVQCLFLPILRLVLKNIANGELEEIGDVTGLANSKAMRDLVLTRLRKE